MKLRVERTHIDKWIDENGPDGLVKLAQKAGVSSSLMNKVRIGAVPKRAATRLSICGALNVSEEVLFPAVRAAKGKAS